LKTLKSPTNAKNIYRLIVYEGGARNGGEKNIEKFALEIKKKK